MGQDADVDPAAGKGMEAQEPLPPESMPAAVPEGQPAPEGPLADHADAEADAEAGWDVEAQEPWPPESLPAAVPEGQPVAAGEPAPEAPEGIPADHADAEADAEAGWDVEAQEPWPSEGMPAAVPEGQPAADAEVDAEAGWDVEAQEPWPPEGMPAAVPEGQPAADAEVDAEAGWDVEAQEPWPPEGVPAAVPEGQPAADAEVDPAAGWDVEAQEPWPPEGVPAAEEQPVAAGEPPPGPPPSFPTGYPERPRPPLVQEAMRRSWVSELGLGGAAGGPPGGPPGGRQPHRRRPDRSLVAAIAAVTIAFLVFGTGLVFWLHVTPPPRHSWVGSGGAGQPGPTQAATGQATPLPGQVGTPTPSPSTSASPGQTQPSAQPTSGPTAVPTPAPTPGATPAPQPTPPVTFAASEVIGLGSPTFAKTGTWNTYSRGGAPDFSSPVFWTGDQSATVAWSLGNPGGGQRWDQTRVRVWIPNPMGGAVVHYTVHWPTYSGSNVQTFDVVQETTNGWHELGVFNIGTATQRTGSIWIVMTYFQPYPNPSDPSCPNGSCWSMGASSAEFAWS